MDCIIWIDVAVVVAVRIAVLVILAVDIITLVDVAVASTTLVDVVVHEYGMNLRRLPMAASSLRFLTNSVTIVGEI